MIKNTLDPAWPEFELSLTALCNGDRGRELRFTVWDWNSSGRPDLIGSFTTSVASLEAGQRSHEAGWRGMIQQKPAGQFSSFAEPRLRVSSF